MSKIQKISIRNFKAIGEFEADFNGCTAIVQAGNNKGKTSFLRGLIDRIRYVRPKSIVKAGESEGNGELLLDTGEKFTWEFDADGKDKISYTTKQGIKRGCSMEFGLSYFPKTFDIDKFLNSGPKEQYKQLQEVSGIDLSDVDKRYDEAYNERTTRNKESEKFHAKLVEMLEVPRVEAVDLMALTEKKDIERARLNNLYVSNQQHNANLKLKWLEDKTAIDANIRSLNEAEKERAQTLHAKNKAQNDNARKAWEDVCDGIDNECSAFNKEQEIKADKLDIGKKAMSQLEDIGFSVCALSDWLKELSGSIEEEKTPVYPIEPTYIPEYVEPQLKEATYPAEPTYIPEMPDRSILDQLDEHILNAQITNQKAAEYKNYVDYKNSVEAAKTLAEEADAKVKVIESERKQLIAKANFPEGIELTETGIKVDNLPLDRNQLSASRITITALQIAAMNLGEVKALFFDASYLDRNSLNEVNDWAERNDLQLLIERPDFDAGELRYELIESSSLKTMAA